MKIFAHKSIAYYSFLLGILVVAMWCFILLSSTIPNGKNEMIFHLISEFMMAGLCIFGGIFLLKNGQKKPAIAAHAMVIYSVINAAGYYFERNEFGMVFLFTILLFISLTILIRLFISV